MYYNKMVKKTKAKKNKIVNRWYNNLEGVRNAGVDDSEYFDPTTEEGLTNIKHMEGCGVDPFYFIEGFVKLRILDENNSENDGRIVNIKLRDYQKDLIKNILNERFIVTMMARQMGKCVHKNTFINIIRKKPVDKFKILVYNLLMKVSFVRKIYKRNYEGILDEKDL